MVEPRDGGNNRASRKPASEIKRCRIKSSVCDGGIPKTATSTITDVEPDLRECIKIVSGVPGKLKSRFELKGLCPEVINEGINLTGDWKRDVG
jgi:hypothetical protein